MNVQYPVYRAFYKCASCDWLSSKLIDSDSPERSKPSPCCTGSKILLVRIDEIEKPSWEEIKEVYG